jgi:iron complex outermembrane receptor protein
MGRRRLLLTAACALAPLAAHAASAPATTDVSEVVVRATPLDHGVDEMATPAVTLSGEELVHRRQATLGDTLSGLPGVNADTFGGGASRPVIRGQTAPRVKVLTDSSELMDASSVSPDHAVTTEPLLIRQIEVLRGPSALLYGGGAISGAVNLVDGKIPDAIPTRGVEGAVEARLGTNADERALVGGVTAGTGEFALHLEGVKRSADDYRAADFGRLAGTFTDANMAAVGGSWVGERGYLGAAYTRLRSQYGLPGADPDADCEAEGSTLDCVPAAAGGDAAGGQSYIDLKSDRFDLRGEARDPLPGVSRLRFRGGVTDYAHSEMEDGVAATTFTNVGYDARLEAEHKPLAGWRGVVGLQTARSKFGASGEEAFLPTSKTRATGLFVFEEMERGAWHVELAARQDWQKITGVGVPEADHKPFSASASVQWKFAEGYALALAVSRSQRAPTPQELYADGAHLATNTFEIGDATLKAETAHTLDLTLRKTSGATTFTLGAFHNRIADYIYADTLDRVGDIRLIRYSQADARFTGVDGEARHQLAPGFAVTVFGDYVRAKLADDGGNLPRIPAGRLGARVEGERGPISGELEYARTFDQDRIAAFEERTPGYNMINATLAYTITAGDREFHIYLRGQNLLDEPALNHASFISRVAPLPGRTITLGLRAGF